MLWGAPGRSTMQRRGRAGQAGGAAGSGGGEPVQAPSAASSRARRLALVEVPGHDEERVVGPPVRRVKGADVVEREALERAFVAPPTGRP